MRNPTTFMQLEALDRDYFNAGTDIGAAWMSSKRRLDLLHDIRRAEGTKISPSKRIPFTPPYTSDDLPQMDELMAAVGMDWQWRRSSARERLMAQRAEKTSPPVEPAQKYQVNISGDPYRRGIQIGDNNVQTNTFHD